MKTLKGNVLFLVLIPLLATCQIPLSGPAKSSSTGLKLSFLIAGAGQSGSGSRSATQARLLLPTVSTISASLTSLNNPQSVSTQTVGIPPGSNQVSLNFGQVNLGFYTVKAQAFDSSGAAQFQQTGTLNVTTTQSSITLNLVPVIASNLNELTSGESVTINPLLAGTAQSWSIPPTALISGGWSIQMTPVTGVTLYAQDSDGALFPSVATAGSTTTVPC